MSKIFISYRRTESIDVAGRIFDYLSEKFGRENIFKDVDNIPPGTNFRKVITNALLNCDVVLVIIGKDWSTVKDSRGIRRLEDPNDFVRLEIEIALENNLKIIPILIGDAIFPKEDLLPSAIRTIAIIHALRIRPDPDFRNDVIRLIKELEKIIKRRYKFWLLIGIFLSVIMGFLVYYWTPNLMRLKTPTIDAFYASQDSIIKGHSTTLYWSVRNSDSVVLESFDGNKNVLSKVNRIGHIMVTPDITFLFKLTAYCNDIKGDSAIAGVFVSIPLLGDQQFQMENSAVKGTIVGKSTLQNFPVTIVIEEGQEDWQDPLSKISIRIPETTANAPWGGIYSVQDPNSGITYNVVSPIISTEDDAISNAQLANMLITSNFEFSNKKNEWYRLTVKGIDCENAKCYFLIDRIKDIGRYPDSTRFGKDAGVHKHLGDRNKIAGYPNLNFGANSYCN